MTTKIKSLTVVCQLGVKIYTVGDKYNDLLLDSIEDRSFEDHQSFQSIYAGLDKEGDSVFETINAPIEVQYESAD